MVELLHEFSICKKRIQHKLFMLIIESFEDGNNFGDSRVDLGDDKQIDF